MQSAFGKIQERQYAAEWRKPRQNLQGLPNFEGFIGDKTFLEEYILNSLRLAKQ